jgi:hypothetical protein
VNFPEEQHRAAEQMESLGTLGSEEGAGVGIWSCVIADELARHVKARQKYVARKPTNLTWERFHGSALVIMVAVDQVLRFEKRVRQLTGDAELARARKAFVEEVAVAATAIRDIAMHLDDYAIGKGNRQTGRHRLGERPITARTVQAVVYWTDLGESYLTLGGDQVSVDRAARASIELAEVVERARDKHQQIAVKRFRGATTRWAEAGTEG